MSENVKQTPEPAVPPDPIYAKSYSVHIAVASVALVGSVALAIADEVWLRRPYKGIQRQYFETYSAYLDRLIAERTDVEAVIRNLDEIRAAQAAVEAAEAASGAEIGALNAEFADLDGHVVALTEALKVANSEIAALTYEAAHHAHVAGDADAAKSDAAKPTVDEIARIRQRPIDYTWQKAGAVGEDGTRAPGETVSGSGTVAELNATFLSLQAAKAKIQNRLGALNAPISAARRARDQLVAKHRDGIQAAIEALPEGDPRRARISERVAATGASRYLDDHHTTLSVDLLRSRQAKIDAMPTDPILGGEIQQYQIHVREGSGWIDRCQVCHLGALEPVPITADALREKLAVEVKVPAAEGEEGTWTASAWSAEKLDSYPLSLFESHPRAKELFADHDPERVACSMCHSGNGIAIVSPTVAHGENKDWLWPAYKAENSEAGCVQCHQQDIHLATGPRITAAREAFLDKGCWGCHKYQGHDPEPDEINRLQGRVGDIQAEIAAARTRQESLQTLLNTLGEEAFAKAEPENKRARDALQETISNLETERTSHLRRIVNLHDERIRVGPNLKDLKAKILPEFLTQWIQDPTAWRPSTKMPVFRWWGAVGDDGLNEEVKDVAAFLWQRAHDPAKFPEYRLTAPQGGSIARGKQLFEQVGCLSCHAMGTGENRVGSDFAANLTNLGDKNRYEYVYRWVKNPRHRIVPWSRTENRDLTEAEWKSADPDTLVWTQPVRMGDLRLSDDEARDIATYLTSQRSGAEFPAAPWLDDAERAKRGEVLVVNQGCAGCHEIAGLEHEKGIGRELTYEGSQPLDRLDFGHVTHQAQRGEDPLSDWAAGDGTKPFGDGKPWYRPRGFFMHKLAKPDVYDLGKYQPDRMTRLRMPQFTWNTGQELTDMTTLLLGSLEPQVPEKLRYRPDADGQAIREGWWVVKKYNCQSCHPFQPGDVPSFTQLPWFADAKVRDRVFPPTLVGEGYRVQADWLAKFLADPSLGGGTAEPKSVRRHLDVRMPSFHLSDDEVAKLVRFFQALAKQPIAEPLEPLVPLTSAEKAVAEKIWVKGNCLQCHLAGSRKSVIDNDTKAPNFVHAGERLQPDWMARWIRDPLAMQPLTSMLKVFTWDEPSKRWITDGAPELAAEYRGDHVDLIVRFVRSLGTEAGAKK